MLGIRFFSFEASGQGHSNIKKTMQHSTTPTCIPNMGFLCHVVKEIRSTHDFKRPKSEVKITVSPKIVGYNQQHHNASKHEIY